MVDFETDEVSAMRQFSESVRSSASGGYAIRINDAGPVSMRHGLRSVARKAYCAARPPADSQTWK